VSLRLQYTIVERNWSIWRSTLPNQPSHDEFCVAATVLTSGDAVFAAPSTASMEEDKLVGEAMVACVRSKGGFALVQTHVRYLMICRERGN
jgi:hypothetical protein